MAIVAGVDFGTLSVRVTLLDSMDARSLGDVLPALRRIAAEARTSTTLEIATA